MIRQPPSKQWLIAASVAVAPSALIAGTEATGYWPEIGQPNMCRALLASYAKLGYRPPVIALIKELKMLIYDVGMHNGDDTHYYLTKGANVVGIEANPELVSQLRQRFSREIESGQLTLLGVGVGQKDGTFPFYVAPNNAQQSSFVEKKGFARIDVPMTRLSSLFRQHGMPDFAKIDVENMDIQVLQDLHETEMVPTHLSVEAHGFNVVLFLYRMGFEDFRLVNGRQIGESVKTVEISTPSGTDAFNFKHHSSGPFGDDLQSPWVKIEQLCAQYLMRHSLTGPGWYDVHAMKRR